MTLSLVIRIINYLVALIALALAANEAREYFVKGSEISRATAIVKIGGPLLAGLLALVVLVLTQRHESKVELENQAKEDAALSFTVNESKSKNPKCVVTRAMLLCKLTRLFKITI